MWGEELNERPSSQLHVDATFWYCFFILLQRTLHENWPSLPPFKVKGSF